MNKVICIDDSNQSPANPFQVKFLETYEPIVEECVGGIYYYVFALTFPMVWFDQNMFIPLSTIDELDEVEKLLRFLEADFYRSYFINL